MVIYISHISVSLIPPKCVKTREPEDEYCVSQCTFILYMQPYTPRQLYDLATHSTAIYNSNRQVPFLYMTISCQQRGQKHLQQRN